jgi:hypothetical protein
MVPYGIGLLGLSWYNLSAAGSATRAERLWTNVIGFNAVVLLSGLSAVLLPDHGHGSVRTTLRAGPGVMLVTISFGRSRYPES